MCLLTFSYGVKYKFKACGYLVGTARFLQLTIFVGVLIKFISFKNYQYTEENGASASYAKIDGASYKYSGMQLKEILDDTRLVIPPKDGDGFFIAIKILKNENQKFGECESMIPCQNDSDCTSGEATDDFSSLLTGKCADSQYREKTNVSKVCLAMGWCPFHTTDPSFKIHHIGKDAKNFTAFITNHVYFAKWNKKESNLLEHMDFEYLRECRYDVFDDKFCPVFKIGDIVRLASDEDADDKSSVWDNGGVFTINIKWDCNYDTNTECKPQYEFHRIDNRYDDIFGNEDMATRGYNFRFANYYFIKNEEHRTFTKVYGLQFLYAVNAKAAKFDLKTTLLNLGSMFSLINAMWGVLFILFFCCVDRDSEDVETKC